MSSLIISYYYFLSIFFFEQATWNSVSMRNTKGVDEWSPSSQGDHTKFPNWQKYELIFCIYGFCFYILFLIVLSFPPGYGKPRVRMFSYYDPLRWNNPHGASNSILGHMLAFRPTVSYTMFLLILNLWKFSLLNLC